MMMPVVVGEIDRIRLLHSPSRADVQPFQFVFLPEVIFQHLPAPYIGPVGVFEVGKFTD